MNYFVLSFLILFSSSPKEDRLIGEYCGGVDFTIWVNLKLKENGEYEYSFSTHTSVSLKDKGTWNVEGNVLELHSFRKVKMYHRGEKLGRAAYLFKNYNFEIQDNTVLLKSKKKLEKQFQIAYFDLIKSN